MPRIVQAARDESHEMNLRDRLVKVYSLSVLFRDNYYDNHFILEKYSLFKYGGIVEMDEVARGAKKKRQRHKTERGISSNNSFLTQTEARLPPMSNLPNKRVGF